MQYYCYPTKMFFIEIKHYSTVQYTPLFDRVLFVCYVIGCQEYARVCRMVTIRYLPILLIFFSETLRIY